MYAEVIKLSFSWVCMAIFIHMLNVHVNCDVTSGANDTEWINETIPNNEDERTTVNKSGSETDVFKMCVKCSVVNVTTSETETETENKTQTDDNVTSAYNVSDNISTTPTVNGSVDVNMTVEGDLESNTDNATYALEWSQFTNETTTKTTVKSHTHGRKPKGRKSGHNRRRKPHLTREQYEYLVRHFTGFMPNIKVGKPSPNDEDDELTLDDGPFGSVLWKDKKYLVTVLIPIGVGITGAMLIIVMAYATRVCRRRKVAERNPRTLLQPSVSRPDDIMLLDQSSDDEF